LPDHTPSLADLLAQLREAAALLLGAERAWPPALEKADLQAYGAEAEAIEELLHVATHETGNQLGFMLQDIDGLLARVAFPLSIETEASHPSWHFVPLRRLRASVSRP